MGGYCGFLLANLGAEVIPHRTRAAIRCAHEGPFKDDYLDYEASLSFAAYHTNKQGSC